MNKQREDIIELMCTPTVRWSEQNGFSPDFDTSPDALKSRQNYMNVVELEGIHLKEGQTCTFSMNGKTYKAVTDGDRVLVRVPGRELFVTK